jgi:phosphoribosylanthranilate isomerase
MTIKVKICGICDSAGAQAAIEAGADLIGFHFCRSERRVTPEDAKAIIGGLSLRPTIVGVFIDQEPEEVKQIADFVGLDLLQLHGSESPGFEAGRPLMKVLKVKDGQVPDPDARSGRHHLQAEAALLPLASEKITDAIPGRLRALEDG